MSKLHLNLAGMAGHILSREELKHVLGGVDDEAKGCSGTTESTCSAVKCKLSSGNEGTCGWTVPTSKCTCAGAG